MQSKRRVLHRDPDEDAHPRNSRKRARRDTQEVLESDMETGGIRRRFASALFVSPGTLIFCPGLSNLRLYPILLAKSINPKLPSPSSYPILNSNLDKTHALPLPRIITDAPAYSYAPPTILSRSHDPRFFLAFFPKLSDETQRRLGQRAAASTHLATLATNQAVQDIVNGADPALATATILSPNDFASQGYDTEMEEYEDLGGVLVLYTRPETSAARITYTHTFDIYASWRTDYCAAACKWLFSPRKWTLQDNCHGSQQDESDEKPAANDAKHGRSNPKVNGVKQEPAIDGIFGDIQSAEASKKLGGEGAASEGKPFVPKRTPVVGPVQPTYSGAISNPTFVVLFADHHLNLYFSAMPTFPTPSGTRASDPASMNSTSAVYPKLDVISCPILTPSVVLLESEESPMTVAGIPAKPENGKADSSTASSPEQPLLQQQQQQILQQQQQSSIGDLAESTAAPLDALPLNSVESLASTPRKVRQIRPGQASIFVREEDETIWVAFRSYRPARIQVPVNPIPIHGTQGANASNQNGTGGSTGFIRSPANTGISSEVVKLLRSVSRHRGPNELSVEALASIGVMREGAAADFENSLQNAPLDNSIDYVDAIQAAKALDDGLLNALEAEEEDWICVTELRLDLLSGIPSVSARPIPQINFPNSIYANQSEQSCLLSFFFLMNVTAQDNSTSELVGGDNSNFLSREGRDLDLVLCFTEQKQTLDSSGGRNRIRLEHIRLSRREVEVSDAFAALSASDQTERKPDIKDLSRLEWNSTELGSTTLPPETFRLQPGLHEETGDGAYFSLRNGAVDRIVRITLNGDHLSLAETDIHLESGHRVLSRSLNSSVLATISPRDDLLITPIKIMSSPVSDPQHPQRALVQAFALAIVNNIAYDDLLRAFESEMRKMDPLSLDSVLSRVWSILQSFGSENTLQIEGNGWLVPYLEFATAAFRVTMDDRVHTSTLLLHLISTENLFFRSRFEDFDQKNDEKGYQRARSYEPDSAWLLLAHMEWYFQLVRTIAFRSVLSAEKEAFESPNSTPALTSAIGFLLSHPAALKLMQTICTEARGFALSVTNNTVPAVPYPGSSQTALTRDAASTSLLQNILRDRIEGLGIRVSEWQRVLEQLSRSQQEHSFDDGAELIGVQLLPARQSRIGEALRAIGLNADIVVSQVELFGSGNRMPDFFLGRDILNKDAFTDEDVPGRQYCQCSICHGIGSLWCYPTVRGYATESMAARWLSQWANRCICGGSWV